MSLPIVIQSADITEEDIVNILFSIKPRKHSAHQSQRQLFNNLHNTYLTQLNESLKVMDTLINYTGRKSLDYKVMHELMQYINDKDNKESLFLIYKDKDLLIKMDSIL